MHQKCERQKCEDLVRGQPIGAEGVGRLPVSHCYLSDLREWVEVVVVEEGPDLFIQRRVQQG